jgi:hypothetical protein
MRLQDYAISTIGLQVKMPWLSQCLKFIVVWGARFRQNQWLRLATDAGKASVVSPFLQNNKVENGWASVYNLAEKQ